MNTQNIRTIFRRWDRIAAQQLVEVVARLAEENDRLRVQLRLAEDAAESWRDDALRLMEEACAQGDRHPAITPGGSLFLSPAAEELNGEFRQ